jgi:NADPH2:quinone reductase
MRAVIVDLPGAPDVMHLCEVDEPSITARTQIKVRIRAAGVNPIDCKIRRHGLQGTRGYPAILGCDGAGEVVATGSEVGRFKIGDRVWFCNGGLGGAPGNYAEFTVIDQSWALAMPDSLSFCAAAAGPLVLITAWEMLFDRAKLQKNQTVLIHAGAGGVGHVAIQLAKHVGARVLTTVGTSEGMELVRTWGADEVINYRDEDFVAKTNELTGGCGADVVIEMTGAETFARSIDCTAHCGDLVTLLDPGLVAMKEARRRNLRIGFELMLTPMLESLDQARNHQMDILSACGGLIDEGKLTLYVSKVFPFNEVSMAHEAIERGHTYGKIVIEI